MNFDWTQKCIIPKCINILRLFLKKNQQDLYKSLQYVHYVLKNLRKNRKKTLSVNTPTELKPTLKKPKYSVNIFS